MRSEVPRQAGEICFLKQHKRNCEDLHLERNSPMLWYILKIDQLESSSLEEVMGILMDTKFSHEPAVCSFTKEEAHLALGMNTAHVSGDNPSPLFCSGEAHLECWFSFYAGPVRRETKNWSKFSAGL